jgi:uncharacterized RDD family membrane protein YckC
MDDGDKSLKFEIDPDQVISSEKKGDKVRRIEGRTVILKRVDGKKPPPVRFNLDTSRMPKQKSRRQMAEDMARKSGAVIPEDQGTNVDKISFVRRSVAFVIDLFIFLVVLFLAYFFYEEKIIALHMQIMQIFEESWLIYSDIVYLIQVLVPTYMGVFFLPALFLEGSIGKRLVGFKIIQVIGSPANFDQLILREIFKPISLLSILGVVIGLFRPYRMLHDRLSRTKLSAA